MANNNKTNKKPNVPGKGRRNYKKNDCNNTNSLQRNAQRSDADYGKRKGDNDIAWYSRNPSLLTAAGQFPYVYRPGMQLALGKPNAGPAERKYNIPGVLALKWMPSIGKSNSSTDPASITAKEIYSRVRQVYSGSLEADAPDFMMYLLALDSIFSYIAWLKRMFRIISSYTPENYLIPDGLMVAMGFTVAEAESLRKDKTKLWQYINELVLMSRKFTCPASMDIFNRHYWMSDNVYTDSASINSQLYMFNLVAVYYLNPNTPVVGSTTNTAAGLQPIVMPTSNKVDGARDVSAKGLYEFGRALINSLVAWDDAYTINGYLMRAYEGSPVFTVDEIPYDQPFNPIYSPEVLSQIENSRTIMGGESLFKGITFSDSVLSGLTIKQNPLTNAVVCNPSVKITYNTNHDNTGRVAQSKMDTMPPVLNLRVEQPTVQDNVIASRLACQSSMTNVVTTGADVNISCATEVPFAWSRIDYDETTGFSENVLSQWIVWNQVLPTGTVATSFPSEVYTLMLDIASFSSFAQHPMQFIDVQQATGTGSVTGTWIRSILNGDIANITTISADDLLNLHKICLLSEFNSFSL